MIRVMGGSPSSYKITTKPPQEMPSTKVHLDDRGWRVFWRKGGDILLVHSYSEGEKDLDCPKCRAPMLFVPGVMVCYACGMTFSSDSKKVSTPFGKHSWSNSACGRSVPYDPRREKRWYEGLHPEDVS